MSHSHLYLKTVVIFFVPYVFGFSIPIIDSGFESEAINHNNTFIYHSNIAADWDRYDPQSVMDAEWSLGLLNPTGGTSFNDPIFGDGVPEGNQAVYTDPKVEHGGEFGITQTLTGYVVTGDTRYTLSVWIGDLAANLWSTHSTSRGPYDVSGFPGYRVQLLADGNILAEDDDEITTTEPHWTKSTVTVTILPNNTNIGKTLGIRLINKNLGPVGPLPEVVFDGVQLEATVITPTPTDNPTSNPTQTPSKPPTKAPSKFPTKAPSESPIKAPSISPSASPTKPSSISLSKSLSTSVTLPTMPPTSPSTSSIDPVRLTDTQSIKSTMNGEPEDDEKDKPSTNPFNVSYALLVILVALLCITSSVFGIIFFIKEHKNVVLRSNKPVHNSVHKACSNIEVNNKLRTPQIMKDMMQYEDEGVEIDTKNRVVEGYIQTKTNTLCSPATLEFKRVKSLSSTDDYLDDDEFEVIGDDETKGGDMLSNQ